MDTFIEQVELLVGGPGNATTKTKLTAKTKKVGRKDDPFAPVTEKYPNAYTAEADPPSPPVGYQRKQKQQRRKKPSLLRRLFCCATGGDEEYGLHGKKQTEAELRAAAAGVVEDSVARPARVHQKDKRESRVLFETTPPTPPLPMMYPDRKPATSAMAKKLNNTAGLTVVGQGMSPASWKSNDASNSGIFDPNSGNNGKPFPPPNLISYPGTNTYPVAFYSYIPKHLSQKAQIRLQQELSKPFSEGDEPGYIYIFWLTDSPHSPLPTPTPSGTPSKNSTRAAKALLQTATAAESLPAGQKPRILLKIGRANNVQRRLHEWSTQCGYNLSLIRFYPHISASSSPAATSSSSRSRTPSLHAQVGKKVPNSHRIEHLIHLELRDFLENPEIQCDACGKTHKEWFSVEASREGLKGVDEIVKKWIDYGERSAMVTGHGTAAQTAPMIPKTTPTKASGTNGTPTKSTKVKQDPVTPTPVQQRPTLKGAPVAGKKAASSGQGKSGSSGKNLTPGGGGRGRSSASPARSSRSNNNSRPSSSNGKAKASPSGRKRGDAGYGNWKNYDENEGDDEYRPDDE